MQINEIKELYTYNDWANERLLRAVESVSQEQLHVDLRNGVGSIHSTLVHMMSGAWIWRARWEGTKPTKMLQSVDFPTLPAIRARWKEEEQNMERFLSTLSDDDLKREIRYSSTMVPDKIFVLPLWKTMIHQINHQTQHRSEIAMRLTELDYSPGELGMNSFFNR